MKPLYIIDITRLVNNLRKGKKPTGVDRVSLEYIKYYANRSLALIRLRHSWLILPYALSQQVFVTVLAARTPTKSEYWLWIILGLIQNCTQFNFSVKGLTLLNTGHSGLENLRYAITAQKLGLKQCYFLHDLIPLSHPEYSAAHEDTRHTARLTLMLNHADAIIVNSEATLRALQQFAISCNLTLPTTVVAYLAPASSLVNSTAASSVPSAEFGTELKKPYFVILGTIEPRKNHWLLLQVWRELHSEMGVNTPQLVIIGRQGWMSDNVMDLLHNCKTLQPYVTHLPSCNDQTAAHYIQHGCALLFPTFIEGYGMPLVEALTLGAPVIASDISVFTEVAGNVPEYISPIDGLGWKKMIMLYAAQESPSRQAQLNRMLNFTAHSWQTHFSRVNQVLDDLV